MDQRWFGERGLDCSLGKEQQCEYLSLLAFTDFFDNYTVVHIDLFLLGKELAALKTKHRSSSATEDRA